MKPSIHKSFIALALLALITINLQLSTAFAQGTAFTYQGRLNDGANPANGIYDLQFAIYDSTNNPGTLIAGPLTHSATAVSNGLFSVVLDFGAGVFNGASRWLEVAVRTNGAATFLTLAPRQNILPEPYAIFAANAANSAGYSGPVSLSQLPPTVALLNGNQTFTGPVAFSNPSNSFAGNGAALNNVHFSTLDGSGVESLPFGNLVFQNSLNSTSSPAATGDMNGDGRIDFIGYDNSTGSLLVMTNDGNSGFSLLASYGPGVSTGNIIVADVNGDGKLDVVTTVGNSVSVYTNNGSGALTLASSTPTGTFPRALATADFNHDGRPDVVTADAGPSTLTVLTNNGNAGFGLCTTITGVGPNVWDVIAADVNGDGRPDIISSKLSQSIISGNLMVFTNNGNNGFVLASTPVTGVNPLGIAAADLNGDNKIDLISADYGAFGAGNTLSVLINDGSGNFSLSSTPGVGTATGPSLITTADVNGDGKIDVFCTTSGTNSTGTFSVSVLTNNGAGILNLATVLPGEAAVLPADINADGHPDLIGSISSTNGASIIVSIADVWLNEPSGISFHIPVIAENGLAVNGVATLNNAANSFSGNGAGLTGLSAGNISSGTLSDARLSGNVALRNANQTFTGQNTFSNTVAMNSPSVLSFGTMTRQMLNLWGTQYGIGVQSYTLYFRTDNSFPGGGFAWYQGGTHNDAKTNSGGGITMMTLDNSGLRVNGTFVSSSDRNVKAGFQPVDAKVILEKVAALPVTRWHYTNDAATTHLGPVAQDFYEAFNIGPDDKHIAVVDEGGVALAAIQGLDQKVEIGSQNSEVRMQKLETENADLKSRLEALEKIVLNQKTN